MQAALVSIVHDFFQQEAPDSRRILHGRGMLFPGLESLCLDWYRPVLLIGAYAPLDDAPALVDLLLKRDRLGQIQSIILQNRYEQQAEAQLLWGEPVTALDVTEGELRFTVRPGRRQNSGLFLDTRYLRDWLLQNSRDKNVLNLFAYTCSLSVAALAGQARAVTNVDMSKPSIRWGEDNHRLNGQDLGRVKSIPHNLFKSWGRIQQFGRYDLVIIDPPTRQRGSFDAERDYAAVVKKLPKLCSPGADVIATLNSPFLDVDFLLAVFDRQLPDSVFIEQMAVAPEFADKFPERALKILRFRMPAGGPGAGEPASP